MSKFVLECQCGSKDFDYDGRYFICTNCCNAYSEDDEAGKNLIAEEE